MNNNKILLAVLCLSLAAPFAAPLVANATVYTSEALQSFDENDNSQQLRDITITEDSSPQIQSGYLDITIPETFPGIFDDERVQSELTLGGSAVMSSKVDTKPELSFMNGDRTVRIPILEDFDVGETLLISKLYLEGFYSETSSSSFLEYQNNGGTVHNDSWSVEVYPTATRDFNAPEAPSIIDLSNTSEGVQITWNNPSDKDLWGIQIFRGSSSSIDVSSVYETILEGAESYLDTSVDEGETYYYYLRATDGPNFSPYSDLYSIEATLLDPVTDPTTDPTTDPVTDPTTDPVTDPSTEPEPETITFTDTIPAWAEVAITALAQANVVEGNPDGSFGAENSLNRAEAAALLWRVLMLGDPTGADAAPFSDVALGQWYTDYVGSLKGLSLVDGNPDGSYQPGESINRAEFLQMAMNVYLYLNAEENLSDVEMTTLYTDLDSSAWYSQTVSNATVWGFVEGSVCTAGTCFNAASEINRAEASQMLYNMFGAGL